MNKQRVGIIKRHITKLSPEEAHVLVEEMHRDDTLRLLLEQLSTLRDLAIAMQYSAGDAAAGPPTSSDDSWSAGTTPGPNRSAPATGRELWLTSVGEKKIAVIKAIREVTGLGLINAKALVDNVRTGVPQSVLATAHPGRLAPGRALLLAAGATAEIR